MSRSPLAPAGLKARDALFRRAVFERRALNERRSAVEMSVFFSGSCLPFVRLWKAHATPWRTGSLGCRCWWITWDSWWIGGITRLRADVCSSLEGSIVALEGSGGPRTRGLAMTVRAADGNSKDDPIDLAVEEEALERYYRRRIREVNRDAAPDPGARGYVSLEELRRAADERTRDSALRP